MALADSRQSFAGSGASVAVVAFGFSAQWVGGKKSYELHHAKPIQNGGEVYDVDNIVLVTPRYHQDVLEPSYHY